MPDQHYKNSSGSDSVQLSQMVGSGFKLPSPPQSTPWYYRVLIKLAKPLYRMLLWKRYKNATIKGLETADFNDEINVRFGKKLPRPPILPVNKDLNTYQHKNNVDQNYNQQPSDLLKNTIFNCTIWCHAVSLGETNTISPMLQELLDSGAKIWLTNTTQTGFARAEIVFESAINSQQMVHTFIPIDDKPIIKSFIDHLKPDLALFVETELWPTTLELLNCANIPSVLANARLSEKSFKSYTKYSGLSFSMMQNITMIIAQDDVSAKRFRQLGADASKIRLASSLKWSSKHSLTSPNINADTFAQNRTKIMHSFAHDLSDLERPIWVAGSTHDGEEQLLLKSHKKLQQISGLENSLLIIIPRHPERFDEVAKLIKDTGFNFKRRSKNELITSNCEVYLADTMGELKKCYQLADVAFVGGSLVNIGGHNPVEAAEYGKPIIMGQYTQSCNDVVNALSAEEGLEIINGQNDDQLIKNLVSAVEHWLSNPQLASSAGQKVKQLVNDKSSAMQNQLDMIIKLLDEHKYANNELGQKFKNDDFEHFVVKKNSANTNKQVKTTSVAATVDNSLVEHTSQLVNRNDFNK